MIIVPACKYLILQFKFAGNEGYKAVNLFQFNSIVDSSKKRGAPGNCPVCPLLNPALKTELDERAYLTRIR